MKIAIVGAGLMGTWHAYYARRVGAEVAAIVDADLSRAGDFTCLEECLRARAIDVVHICTPAESHPRLVAIALAANKHVLVEKPLSLSKGETEQLLSTAAERGRALGVVHQFPFQRGFRRLRRALPRLGELSLARHTIRSAGGDNASPAQRRQILREMLAHPVSLFYALFGSAIQGLPWQTQRDSAGELELCCEVRSTRLEIELSLRGRPPCNELLVVGSQGSGQADLFHGYSFVDKGGQSRSDKILRPFRLGTGLLLAAGNNLLRRTIEREPAYPGLRLMIEHFYQAVRDETTVVPGVAEALLTAHLLEQVGGSEVLFGVR